MFLRIQIGVEVEKTQGVFCSKDAIFDAIVEELGEPGALSVDDSEYEVTSFDIERVES